MNTYLLTWNPDRWAWQAVAEAAETTARGESFVMPWSAGNTRTIPSGSRVFLLKQGPEPRGIVASGWTASGCYDGEHWDEAKAAQGETLPFVDVEFDRVIDPARIPPLDVTGFTTGPLSEVYWAIPASGTRIKDEAAAALEVQWQKHTRPAAGPKTEPDKPRRNPAWQRDELILALDLYVRHGGRYLSEAHADIIALSELLNVLPIHPDRAGGGTFRNPNGVSMKLLNFRRFDPTQRGEGLTRGNRLEGAVWNQYASDPALLSQIAESIRRGYKRPEGAGFGGEFDEEEAFPEGRIVFRLHRARERNRGLVERAKANAKRRHGRLRCQVCEFDFGERYGTLGEDFIECHHTRPLAEVLGEQDTRLADIATLCPNCHRMVHRKRPWLALDQLGAILKR